MKKVIELDANRKNRKLNKKKVVMLSAVIGLIILLIIITAIYNTNKNFRNFMDKYIFRKDVTEENVPMIEIDYDSNISVIPYGKNICILAENTLFQYNSSGKQEKQVKIQINDPVYDVEGKYLVIGEKNSQKIYLISGDHIIWEGNIEGNLYGVSVNKNGYVSAIVTGTTHKSVIVTYDEKGKELFKSFLSNTVAVDTAISPDNEILAYAEVNTSGTTVQSNIKLISIKEAKEKKSYVAPQNSLILRIKYQDKDKLICLYDDSIHMIEKEEDKEILKLNEDDKKITFADIELNNHIFRAVEKSTGLFKADTVIEFKNTSNQWEHVYTIEEVAKSINCYNDIIAVNLGAEIDFINTSGWLVKRYKSTQVVQNIVLCDGLTGIVYRDKIELVSL